MDRTEKIGLGTAIAGHVLLFALLSARFFAVPVPTPMTQSPLEVSLVKDVALEAAAPKAAEPPAPSIAPDRGLPEDAAPPEPAVAEPEPEPKPAPPPETPAPPKPRAKPAPPKPVEKTVPAPKPVPATKPAPIRKTKPQPAAESRPAEKTAPAAKPSHAKTNAAAVPKASPAAVKGTGSNAEAKTKRPRGSLLGDDFLKGLSDKPSKSQSLAPVAARIDARALASIQAAIERQLQPCANQQRDPGPGANQIVTVFDLRLNQDGSLAATPHMMRQTGIDDDNSRYAQRVIDLGVAAFKGCTPLKLPAEFYSTPAGGWNHITYNWRLK